MFRFFDKSSFFIKISKDSTAKYYQDNKKDQKKFAKDIKVFSKKKMKKSDKMDANDIKGA